MRHNLSLESIFSHVRRPDTEPGKGGYWTLTNKYGYGQKRLRKRNPKNTKESAIIKTEEEDQLEDEDDDDSSGAQRTAGSSRSHYLPTNQSMSSYYSGRMMPNTLVPLNSGIVFGQTSFPAPVPSYARHPNQPVRTQSLPSLGGQAGAHQPPHRPATAPIIRTHDYYPLMGIEERERRLRGNRGQYPSPGDMDVDEDPGRATSSRLEY